MNRSRYGDCGDYSKDGKSVYMQGKGWTPRKIQPDHRTAVWNKKERTATLKKKCVELDKSIAVAQQEILELKAELKQVTGTNTSLQEKVDQVKGDNKQALRSTHFPLTI